MKKIISTNNLHWKHIKVACSLFQHLDKDLTCFIATEVQHLFQLASTQMPIHISPSKKIFTLLSAECAISCLLMTAVTSPDNQSPVRPSLNNDCNTNKVKSNHEFEDYEEDTHANYYAFQNSTEKNCADILFNPNLMNTDSTYNHKIKISLLIIYGVEPKNICNQHEYSRCCQAIKANVMNQFKDPWRHAQLLVIFEK